MKLTSTEKLLTRAGFEHAHTVCLFVLNLHILELLATRIILVLVPHDAHANKNRAKGMSLRLSKNLRRFSYTKDFCSLHINGLYLYDTQGFIAN